MIQFAYLHFYKYKFLSMFADFKVKKKEKHSKYTFMLIQYYTIII